MQIKISEINEDISIYPRNKVNIFHINELTEALRAGAEFPPLIIDEATKTLIDGRHRKGSYIKHFGPEHVVTVEARKYKSKAEMILDAMKENSVHGTNLTSFDKLYAAQIAVDLGVERELIADALNITTDKYDSWQQTRYTADREPLKHSLTHFSNKKIKQIQSDYNKRAVGINQVFLLNQIIELIESESLDTANPKVIERIDKLRTLL